MNPKILRRVELLEGKSRKLRLKEQRGSMSAEINVTPLVDVVLVLLIIFMLVVPKLSENIKLPVAWDPETVKETKDALNISMKRAENGRPEEISISEKIVTQSQLAATLQKELKKNPFRTVYIAADEGLQFRSIREVLSALREAGVTQAGLMSKLSTEQ